MYKVLKVEVFVHTDGQLRAAHLILDYISISKSFLAPKCIIKAKDPWLQRIGVATPGFLLTSPILEGTFTTKPMLEGILKVASSLQPSIGSATSSRLANTKEEKVVKVPNFEDEFEVFNQTLSLDTSAFDLGHPFTPVPDEMGIQQKPRSNLLNPIES